jgi:hypothetical protein
MITPEKFLTLAIAAQDRFWSYVDKSAGPDGCWPWLGADDGRRGYGKFKLASYESARTHRIAYALANGVGPILDVLHRCDNPPCCNPAHLFEGDHNANMADMVSKGRSIGGGLPGELSQAAKLTAAQVVQIRARIKAGESNVGIARDYGVGDDIISRIKMGKAWVAA